MKITKLKGGSLSTTNLIDDGVNIFVRKTISLIHDREYGYQRWYSQYKRLQRYPIYVKNIFPAIINMGVDGNFCYFDIEYIQNSKNGFEFLSTATNSEIDDFFISLIKTMDKLHSITIQSSCNSIDLYIHEEIDCRLKDTLKNNFFKEFSRFDEINFMGEKIPSFIKNIDKYKEISKKYYTNPLETLTHGNLTLENILYVKNDKKIIFIDPYEENVIDSKLAEISQLLQSCNSFYEIYNNGIVEINGNNIDISVDIPLGILYFNNKLKDYIEEKYNFDEKITILVLEISQFIRMLPFKSFNDQEKCIFFYGLASKLLNDLIIFLNKK